MTFFESSSRFSFVFEHDLFRKPLHTFRDHALALLRHKIRCQSLCPLPLRERATRCVNATDWVRGQAQTPHPCVLAEGPALPSPARGEGATTGAAARGRTSDAIRLVPRTRSSRATAASPIANFGFKGALES